MHPKHPLRSPLLTLWSTLALLIAGCSSTETPYIMEEGTRFHTLYHFSYQSERSLSHEIDSTLDAFNSILNNFDSTSLVARFNRNETEELHPMLLDVVRQAMKVSAATDGIYDITGAPLFDVWGFGTRKGVTRTATQAEVDSILTIVGYEKLHLDTLQHRITKADPRMILNPSSLSKGYAVDLVARTLEQHGVTNYMVEIGGEVVAKGLNPRGECWNLGINKPIEDNTHINTDLMQTLRLCGGEGMATSGDYRNYKVIDGTKVAHTMNARTGYPAHSDLLGVTVVAPTCMEADAWATAFMAVGLQRSLELLEQQQQLSALLIYADTISGDFVSQTIRLDRPTP